MRYELINAQGEVTNVIEANADHMATHFAPGEYRAAEIQFAASDEPVADRHISQLAFLSRFTDAEAIGIDLASIGATVEAATMRRYTAKIQAAKYIDLDMPDTRAGVQALEMFGLIAQGRAIEILDAPVEAKEHP